MEQSETYQAMRLILQKEASLATIQSFEMVGKIDLMQYSEALALADALVERAHFMCHLLTRYVNAGLTETQTEIQN